MSVSLIWKLGISSIDAITLYPEFDIEQGKRKIQNNHRTASGRGFNYLWSIYDRFGIPIEFISANNASIINSWWESDTELLFFKIWETESGAPGEPEYLETIDHGGLELVEPGSGYLELVETTSISYGYITEVFSVYIMNNRQPFREYQKPYNTYQKGSIVLETY